VDVVVTVVVDAAGVIKEVTVFVAVEGHAITREKNGFELAIVSRERFFSFRSKVDIVYRLKNVWHL